MSGLTNALVAQQVQALLDTQKRQTDYLTAWLGGSPTGGPNNDGRYPFVDLAGVEILVPRARDIQQHDLRPGCFGSRGKGRRRTGARFGERSCQPRERSTHLGGSRSRRRRGTLAIWRRNIRTALAPARANAEYWANLARTSGQGSEVAPVVRTAWRLG